MTSRPPRADAVRNRDAVLRAADDLFAGRNDATGDVTHDVTVDVTTEDIARRAGVGKATLFRGFGGRAGLLRAVYEVRVADLLAKVSDGPPPLGPGGTAVARIPAVLDAILTFKIENRALSRALELVSPNSPYAGRHYEAWHDLITAELRCLGLRGTAPYYGDLLLAAVRSDLIEHELSVRGMSTGSLRTTLRGYVQRVLSTLG